MSMFSVSLALSVSSLVFSMSGPFTTVLFFAMVLCEVGFPGEGERLWSGVVAGVVKSTTFFSFSGVLILAREMSTLCLFVVGKMFRLTSSPLPTCSVFPVSDSLLSSLLSPILKHNRKEKVSVHYRLSLSDSLTILVFTHPLNTGLSKSSDSSK